MGGGYLRQWLQAFGSPPSAGGSAVAGGSIELSGLTKRFGEIAVDT